MAIKAPVQPTYVHTLQQQGAMEQRWQKQQQQRHCTQRPHTHAHSMSQSYFSIRSNARCANHQFIVVVVVVVVVMVVVVMVVVPTVEIQTPHL